MLGQALIVSPGLAAATAALIVGYAGVLALQSATVAMPSSSTTSVVAAAAGCAPTTIVASAVAATSSTRRISHGVLRAMSPPPVSCSCLAVPLAFPLLTRGFIRSFRRGLAGGRLPDRGLGCLPDARNRLLAATKSRRSAATTPVEGGTDVETAPRVQRTDPRSRRRRRFPRPD